MKETWTGPNGIEYEFIQQFGKIMSYYECDGRWIHATREFDTFDELHQWQKEMCDKYNRREKEEDKPTVRDIDPYRGTIGNYVGD